MIRFEREKKGGGKKRRRKRKRRRGREIFRIRFGSIRKVIFIGSAIPLEMPVRSSVPLKRPRILKKGVNTTLSTFSRE